MSLKETLLTALWLQLFASTLMAGLWWRFWVQDRRGVANAGVVDVVWAGATTLFALVFSGYAGNGAHAWLAAGLVSVWGARLTNHLAQRAANETEDQRYTQFRKLWGERFYLNLFGLFQLQAAWVTLFALPVIASASSPRELGWLDGAAILVAVVSIAGEAVADRQLKVFRLQPQNRGQVCGVGLWRWSRHPNYFFEWLMWFAYPLLAPEQWLSWLGAPLMLLFLLKVTGLPLTEAHLLRTRGDAYRAYQKRTSAFFPWFPRKGVKHEYRAYQS